MTMKKNKTIEDFEKVIGECVKCGVCQAHCPAYEVERKEGAVARGKISLAAAFLHGETGLESRLQEDMSMCLMCGSCVKKCPNKVPTHEIVGAIRREITNNEGLGLVGKSVSHLLASKPLMAGLSKTGALFSPLLLKKVPQSSGLRLRFPTPVMKDRTLPKMSFRSLFDRVEEYIEGHHSKPVVGFFAGCSISYIYPEIGEQMVRVLKGMGCSVFLPRSQKCCGIPAISAGNGNLVEELAAANIQAFAARKVDHVVTACGSCNGGIGEYYSSMKDGDDTFTDKVVDFSVFLKKQGLFQELREMEKWSHRTKVTYHDPCHLKTQAITKEPRELLQSLPNIDFVEMEGADRCCGLGGTFSVYHYGSSRAIGEKKIPGLRESGAAKIATACPGCIISLDDGG